MKSAIILSPVRGLPGNRKYIFEQDRIMIGRSFKDNDFVINHHSVAGIHAGIEIKNSRILITNFQEEKACLIKGVSLERGQSAEILDMDEFNVGDIRLALNIDDGAHLSADIKMTLENAGNTHSTNAKIPSKIINKALLFKKPTIFAVLILIGIGLIFSIFGKRTATDQEQPVTSEKPCNASNETTLPTKETYGYIPSTGFRDPLRAIFVFNKQTVSSGNIELYYTAGGIEKTGEVIIRLNDQKIADVPPAPDKWGGEQVIRLPDDLIKGDTINRIIFENSDNIALKNSAAAPGIFEKWGVKNIYTRILPFDSCDVKEARRLTELADKIYEEKAVGKQNLFLAHQYYRKAAENLKHCDEESIFRNQITQKEKSVKAEMDQKFNDLLFAFKKSLKINNLHDTKQVLEEMILLIPDKSDERHVEAKNKLRKLNQMLRAASR